MIIDDSVTLSSLGIEFQLMDAICSIREVSACLDRRRHNVGSMLLTSEAAIFRPQPRLEIRYVLIGVYFEELQLASESIPLVLYEGASNSPVRMRSKSAESFRPNDLSTYSLGPGPGP